MDLSLLTAAGQRVQNVADQAALSGARSYADAASAEAVVEEVAAANSLGCAWQVTPATQCYGPGEAVPGYATLQADEYAVDVAGSAQFSFFFGRMLGLTTTQVHRRAVAVLNKNPDGAGDTFIFGGTTAPGVDAVKIMGQRINIEGDIHSNSNLRIGGGIVDGDVSHVGSASMTGGGHVQGDDSQSSVLPYPVDYTWAQYDQGTWDYEVSRLTVSGSGSVIPSGRWRVRGDMNISGNGVTAVNSLFVVDGNVNVSASNKVFDGVTIIARGTISLSGSNSTYSPYLDNLLAFSLVNRSPLPGEQGISINAADCELSGIAFAPRSAISINGSREQTYHISLIGETVTLMGSDCTYTGPSASEEEDDLISDVRLVL